MEITKINLRYYNPERLFYAESAYFVRERTVICNRICMLDLNHRPLNHHEPNSIWLIVQVESNLICAVETVITV